MKIGIKTVSLNFHNQLSSQMAVQGEQDARGIKFYLYDESGQVIDDPDIQVTWNVSIQGKSLDKPVVATKEGVYYTILYPKLAMQVNGEGKGQITVTKDNKILRTTPYKLNIYEDVKYGGANIAQLNTDYGKLQDDINSLREDIENIVNESGLSYEILDKKPKINGVELIGDLSPEDLGLSSGGGSGEQGPQGEQGPPGKDGKDGKSIEYKWRGTELGIRQEGGLFYDYVDLKGDKGDSGEGGSGGIQDGQSKPFTLLGDASKTTYSGQGLTVESTASQYGWDLKNTVKHQDNSVGMSLGVYGSGTGYNYGYLGTNRQNSALRFLFKSDNSEIASIDAKVPFTIEGETIVTENSVKLTEIKDELDAKADKEHMHNANDIHQSYSKNFVSMAEKLKIQEIDNKADKDDKGLGTVKDIKTNKMMEMWTGSQEEYDALGNYSDEILYIVKEG